MFIHVQPDEDRLSLLKLKMGSYRRRGCHQDILGSVSGLQLNGRKQVRNYAFRRLLLKTYHRLRGTGTVTGRLAEDPYGLYQQGMLWPY